MADARISDLPSATLPLNLSDTLFVMQGGELHQVTFQDALESLATSRVVTTPQVNNTTTPASVTELELYLAAGTYAIEGSIVYRSAGTGVGIQMYLDADTPGNVSRCAMTWWYSSTGTLAATGIADQVVTGGAAQLLEGKSQNAVGVASGNTLGVDTANADMYAEIGALVVVTAPVVLKLMFNASAGGTNVSIMEGSCLIPTWTG